MAAIGRTDPDSWWRASSRRSSVRKASGETRAVLRNRRTRLAREALADVLDFHKIINTEEKRRGVEALGAEMIGKLTYYERWIVAFANILFQKGILTPSDLARKMDEVAARLPAGPSDPAAGSPPP